MKAKKRILAAVAAIAVLASMAAYADETAVTAESAEAGDVVIDYTLPDEIQGDIMLINETATEEIAAEDGVLISEDAEEVAAINGVTLPYVEVKTHEDIVMMPLREVAEGFGYTVNWNDENWSIELFKGPLYVTMAIGEDAYAFGRMAHRPLGVAPTLIDDKTYVPLAFVEEILGGYAEEVEEGFYKFVTPSIVTVKGFTEEGSIIVEDEARGEVVVHVADYTKIFAGDKEVAKEEIKEGMLLGVEYGMAMTMSIPPQTTAERIILQNVVVEEIAE